jgi:hypothetical protein
MLIRYGRRYFGFTLAALTAVSSFAQASSDPRAVQCVEDFLSHYRNLKSYQTRLIKNEWNEKGKALHSEKIGLTFSKPHEVEFKYLNEGNTGIRNNGMTVAYKNGDEVSIRLGSTAGLGFLVKGVASLIVGDHTSLYDSKVLEDEIFTLNRAGFDFLAFALDKHLPAIKTSEKGGVKMINGEKADAGCTIKYTPEVEGEEIVDLKPEDSVRAIEEKYGTLAYLIYRKNTDEFDSLRDLFVRDKETKIHVPKSFMEFDLTLDPVTKLPTHFVLYNDGKKIGDYGFQDTQLTFGN